MGSGGEGYAIPKTPFFVLKMTIVPIKMERKWDLCVWNGGQVNCHRAKK